MHLHKHYEETDLSTDEQFNIIYSKLAMGNQLVIPYFSLSDLYRHEHTIKFIWNASQIHAKTLTFDEEVNSRKFYKFYFRKLKPCPFINQILNSLIPVAVVQSSYGTLKNF